MRAYHARRRHEIRLAARALVADVDGEPCDGRQRGFFSSCSTSALVRPMSSSRWSSSSASTRRCLERARLEVTMRLPPSLGFIAANSGVSFLVISEDCAAALATVARIGIVRMSGIVDLVSLVS